MWDFLTVVQRHVGEQHAEVGRVDAKLLLHRFGGQSDLATDELVQKKRPEQRRQREPSNRPEDKGGILADYGLSEEQGNEIIMAARAHWFEDEGSTAASNDSGQEDAVADQAQ